MGRVIRHRWDYGAILLADARFAQPNTLRQTSAWLKEHIVAHENFGAAASSLQKFFRVRAVMGGDRRTGTGRGKSRGIGRGRGTGMGQLR